MQDLWVLFLFYIEEATAAAFLGLSLFGIRPGFKKVLLIGSLQGFSVWLIRSLFSLFDIPVGGHVLFTLLSMILLIKFIAKIRLGLATAIGLLSFVSIVISEALIYPSALKMFGLTLVEVNNSSFWHIVTAYIGDSLMFVLAIVVGMTNFTLFRPK